MRLLPSCLLEAQARQAVFSKAFKVDLTKKRLSCLVTVASGDADTMHKKYNIHVARASADSVVVAAAAAAAAEDQLLLNNVSFLM
jgi:hypothetical protein